MAVDNEYDAWVQEVNAAIQEWHQGDYVLEEQWFVQRCHLARPLTQASQDAVKEGNDLAEYNVQGFVVVTQTCDIVRPCDKRPFIEVVPLVTVDKRDLYDIQKGRRPQYAYIPGAAKHCLVADLDRVMTLEKAVLSEWERKAGCSNDQEVRTLGHALARKRVRFAFPDDFNQLTRKLQARLKEKHDNASPEGEALRDLREIRVRAAPSWDNTEIGLMFWFIRYENQVQFQGAGWDQQLTKWLDIIPKSGRFKSIEGLVVTLEDMTAKDYVESDPLDLDHLSR